MPKYQVLRDCFTGNRYYARGSVVELDDNVVKNPKNFKPVLPPAPSEIKVETIPQPTTTSTGAVQSVTPAKEFKCSVCGKVVSSALALSGHSRSHKEVKNGSSN